MPGKRLRRSEHFLRVLEPYAEVAIITHDSPDPDGLAAGWALLSLVRRCTGKPVRFIAGGAIVRAENVRFMELLRPPVELVTTYAPGQETAPVLVDCLPEAANHLLGAGEAAVVAVIDHHIPPKATIQVPHRDIRKRASASATIAGTYLRELGEEPSTELATALLYAVRTESIGTYRPFARWERGVIAWLAERADHRVLADIEEAPLARGYFRELALALQDTLLYDTTAICFLPHADEAEIVGEVADLLIRCTGVDRVLCAAVVGQDLLFSARTTRDAGDAVKLLDKTLSGIGHWGGHPHRAGGKIAGRGGGGPTSELLDQLRSRWLAACGVGSAMPQRLVSPPDVQMLG
jgi:nanoRNase/pAp phosphatase (c-di-AMP/oligoRNAs hydrolase)